MSELACMLAGFGGQGVLFAGKVLAHVGLIEDKHVSWLPSYGPEMRGGTANCSVVISDEEIGSPLITHPNVLIAMNQPSFDKFTSNVTDDGLVIFDSSLVTEVELADVRASGIPATKLSEDNGLAGLANMVLIGRLWKEQPFCSRDVLEAALSACVPARKHELLEKNQQAIALGIDA